MRLSFGILLIMLVTLAGCGGGIDWFPEQTVSTEPTPTAFAFTAKTCQAPSVDVVSDDVTIEGVTSNASVSIVNGSYSYDKGVTWHNDKLVVTPSSDQKVTIRVRNKSAATTDASEVVITALKVGNTTGYFASVINIGQTSCK